MAASSASKPPPKTLVGKSLQKSVASISNASDAKYKPNLPHSSLEMDPKIPESCLTDLRALHSSAVASARSVALSHRTASSPPTSDPIPIDLDEDEDVVMLSGDENQVISIKSVHIFIFGSFEKERKAETMFVNDNDKRKVVIVIDDSDDDDTEAQSNVRQIVSPKLSTSKYPPSKHTS